MIASVPRAMAAALVLALPVAAPALDFVRDGRLNVRFDAPAPAEADFAEREFFRVLDAVTGCGAKPAPGAAAIVCTVNPALGPGDAFKLSVRADGVAIAGANPESVGYAIFELLERLGCRWFWPGPDGEFLPPRASTLALAPFTFASRAAIGRRELMFHPTRALNAQWKAAFCRRQRLHPRKVYGGHLFNWVRPADCPTPRAYFERHPEQHALWRGERSFEQHCYSNPDTFKTFVDFYVRQWQAHPEAEYLSLAPKDAPVYCTCAECARAGDSSTLYFAFINRLVEALEQVCPGKRYTTLAYSFYWKVPRVKLHPAIVFEYCMYDRCYRHPFGAATCPLNPRAVAAMDAWQAHLGRAPGIYGYHFDIWKSPVPMLAPLAGVLQDEIRWARARGVDAWRTEWFGDWQFAASGAHETVREMCPEFAFRFPVYALCRLLWNPDLELEALRRDFCARVYGPAAGEMAAYLRALEAAWGGDGHVGAYNAPPDAQADSFVTPRLVAAADAAFAAAERQLARAPDARASREVALEKIFWLRWRDLKAGRAQWERRARAPDPERLAYLLDTARADEALYPLPGDDAAQWADWRADALTPRQQKQFVDYLVWGHHPSQFRGEPWINYECTFEFQFAADEPRKELVLHLRNGRERFGEAFRSIAVRFDDTAYLAEVDHRPPAPACALVPRTRRPCLLGDRPHRVTVRLADTKMRVIFDGRTLYTVDVPLGAGPINIWSRASSLVLRGISVRRLAEPPPAQGSERIDGTGRRVRE